ncbi:glycosyl transferase family 92 [Dyadobacter jejuensis]|uniref:Glycosyl transferase family 92 n=1 Tax=Dyadobacter jejuensis TaxID=1082580 RepID=A0A316AN75_9BACT|nr:glycosyltransferase family 2 protein [Dyadobacter jejuensis]PWJ58992.1 glycosyl transferase family 92 [Dyadobacter jejuensis]
MKKIKWKLPHITDTLLGRIFLKKRHQVGICCIIKDENQYLEEWMRYHLQIGVTHFFIYDNESTVSVRDTLARLDLLTYATVIDFPGKSQQVPAYAHCLEHFGFWCRWLAFID